MKLLHNKSFLRFLSNIAAAAFLVLVSAALFIYSQDPSTPPHIPAAIATVVLGVVVLILLRRHARFARIKNNLQNALAMASGSKANDPETVTVQGASKFPGVSGAVLIAQVPGRNIEPLVLAGAGTKIPSMAEIEQAVRKEKPTGKLVSLPIPTWPGSPPYCLVLALERPFEQLNPLQMETFAQLAGGYLASGTALREYSVAQTRLEELERQMKTAQEKILREARSSLMGKMVTNIAHELNNPLAAVLGSAQALQSIETDPQSLDMLSKLKEEILRCKDIVDQVTGLAEQNTVEPQKTQLHRIIEESFQILNYRFRRDRIDLQKNFMQGTPEIVCDEGLLIQAFLNLANVMAEILAVSPEPRIIRVTTAKEGPLIQIKIGSDKSLPLPSAWGLERPGTRLNLWVAGAIFEEHGGKLDSSPFAKGEAELRISLNLKEKTILQKGSTVK